MVDVGAYLERIGLDGKPEPEAGTLRELHRAHLLAVPFENLDIHLGRRIVLDVAALERKIVGERRGGFCYELNGAFSALLGAIGYQVSLLEARVRKADGSGFGPPFDHLLLRVRCPGSPQEWLADVGFGDSYLEPLRMVVGPEQADPTGRLTLRDDRLIVTDGGHRSERPIDGEPAFRQALLEHFGVRLPAPPGTI